MLLTTSCDYTCWKCTHHCEIVHLFGLPDPVFNKIILDTLKARAGMLITQNYDLALVDQDLMESAVTLKLSRELFLKKYHF